VLKIRFLLVGCCVLTVAARCWGEDPPISREYGETSVAFAPNCEWVVTGGADSKVRIRDATDNGALRAVLIGHDRMATAVAVSPDGQTVASGSNDGTIRLWDVKSWSQRRVLRVPEFSWGICLAFAPDGRTIASGSAGGFGSGSSGGCLRLWDVESGELKASWRANSHYVRAVLYTPDGRTIASIGDDCIIKFWDAQSHLLQRELPQPSKYPGPLAFSADGSMLASIGASEGAREISGIRVLDARTGVEKTRLHHILLGIPRALAFTPDGGHLAAASNKGAYLFSTGTIVDEGDPVAFQNIAGADCVALAISRTGQQLALGFLDHKDTGHATFQIVKLP